MPLDSDLSASASFQLAEAARVALLDMEAEDHGAHSHGHSHGHSHSHGHGDAGPPRVGRDGARRAGGKTCPVVASLPTQADLERRVAEHAGGRAGRRGAADARALPERAGRELDVYLEPTLEMGEGVRDTRAAGAGVTKLLNDAAIGASVANVFWSLDREPAPV